MLRKFVCVGFHSSQGDGAAVMTGYNENDPRKTRKTRKKNKKICVNLCNLWIPFFPFFVSISPFLKMNCFFPPGMV
jgi:hypothetical protein